MFFPWSHIPRTNTSLAHLRIVSLGDGAQVHAQRLAGLLDEWQAAQRAQRGRHGLDAVEDELVGRHVVANDVAPARAAVVAPVPAACRVGGACREKNDAPGPKLGWKSAPQFLEPAASLLRPVATSPWTPNLPGLHHGASPAGPPKTGKRQTS